MPLTMPGQRGKIAQPDILAYSRSDIDSIIVKILAEHTQNVATMSSVRLIQERCSTLDKEEPWLK